MPLFESNDHPNQNNSKWLAFINILSFLVGIFIPLIFNVAYVYTFGFFAAETILLAYTIFAAKTGFQNTVETNDDWKSFVQVSSAIVDIIIPALFIGISNTQ